MANGQEQGNGTGPFDCNKTATTMTRDQTDSNTSIEIAAGQTTFHCCVCYEKAVAYDHAGIAKDLLEQAVRTAGDIVIDAKFGKQDTEEARAFLMDFIRKQKAGL